MGQSELRHNGVLRSSLPMHSHLAYKTAYLARDKWPSGIYTGLPAAAIMVASDSQGSDNIVGGGRRTPGDGRQNPERWTRLPTHPSAPRAYSPECVEEVFYEVCLQESE